VISAPKCLVNFSFTKEVALGKINDIVEDVNVGNRYTFKLDWRNDKIWIHEYGIGTNKRERSKVIWNDSQANNLKAIIECIKPKNLEKNEDDEVRLAAVRTCGSLIEWMMRHAEEYLDEEGDLEKISVEVICV